MVRSTIRFYLTVGFLFRVGIALTNATYVLFLMSEGLNLFQVSLVNFVYFTLVFLLEVPTGSFADVYGRKKAFTLGAIIFALGMFAYGISDSFLEFAIAEAIIAVGSAFESGAFKAWMVDRLDHFGHQGPKDKIFSRSQQVFLVGGMLGSVSGGYLVFGGLETPWLIGGGFVLISGLITLFFMKEEYFEKNGSSFTKNIKEMVTKAKEGVRFGFKEKTLLFLIILTFAECLAVQGPNMQWQPYFKDFIPEVSYLGYVFASFQLAILLGASIAPRFSKMFKDRRNGLLLVQGVIALGIVVSGISGLPVLVMSAYLIHEAARGLTAPLEETYLNEVVKSKKKRATILSVESATCTFGGMVGLLLSGYMAETTSISLTWIVSGAVLLLAVIFLKKKMI